MSSTLEIVQSLLGQKSELNKRTIRFSVITPTRNAARFLEACLNSVAIQRDLDIDVEHIILDGGSQDNTLEIAKRFQVKFLPRRPDQGLVEAMCMGFEYASGDLVSFLGADDILLPGALSAVASTYRKEQREVIFGRSRWVDGNLRSLGELAPLPNWCSAAVHASLGWCYATASATFLSPQVYLKLGGFDMGFHKSEDYDLVTRILHQRIPFSRVSRTISLYRRHDNNESMQHDTQYWSDLEKVQARFAPPNRIRRCLFCLLMKSWVYARNPNWSWHQLKHKFQNGSFRG